MTAIGKCYIDVPPQVTRSSSYSKKSHFQVEEEDIEKLEIM